MTSTYRFPLRDPFIEFIVERHAIFERRQRGDERPWTKDPILAEFRFCNVYRELDRVTMWIAKHWREPNKRDPNVFFAMAMSRLINKPETLAHIDDPTTWSRAKFLRAGQKQREADDTIFGAAYIVSTAGYTMDKMEYLADFVLEPLWKKREKIAPKKGDTLQSFFNALQQCNGFGSFMAAQIVADMKYTPALETADDWWTFASSGPGSKRGLNYVIGRDPAASWQEHEWRDCLAELDALVTPRIKQEEMEPLHRQDLQNCLCEYSKYRRTQLKTGRPKQKFKPSTEALP